jgi:ribosomal protein S18 acetylase RimI-like enzyme
MNVATGCRELREADVQAAAQVMSQAYMEDPLCAFMLPHKNSRAQTLLKFFLIINEFAVKSKRVYGVGDPLQGVAYWEYPGQEDLSINIKSLGKLLPLLFSRYLYGYFRARPITAQIDALRKAHANTPHYYLDNLGVAPAARGQGLASKLLRPMLDKADAEKALVYTDTVTQSNVGLYEHFGFVVVEERTVPNTGITIWALHRPAQ